MWVVVFNVVLLYLLVLVLLGYFTLLERKLLGYGQLRKGPNKGVLFGLFQPLLDGFKLFNKSLTCHWGGALASTYLFGGLGLVAVFGLWWTLAGACQIWGVVNVLVLFVLLGSLSGLVYYVVGFETCGVYSVYGSVRMLAQVLTYEGVLFFVLVSLFLLGGSMQVEKARCSGFVCVILFLLLATSAVLESSRTPVDFVEGESELVSGLVTELGGLSFSLLFLLEYGGMGFYSCLWCYMLGGWFTTPLMLSAGAVVVMALFNWLRMSLPRSRYDLVMEWGWKCLLVLSLVLVLWVVVCMAAWLQP